MSSLNSLVMKKSEYLFLIHTYTHVQKSKIYTASERISFQTSLCDRVGCEFRLLIEIVSVPLILPTSSLKLNQTDNTLNILSSICFIPCIRQLIEIIIRIDQCFVITLNTIGCCFHFLFNN